MIESVTLITAPEQAVGIRSYSDGLRDALRMKGVKVQEHSYWKRDLRIGGRNIGAVATPMLARIPSPPEATVTHATFSNFASRRTGVVTVMDLVWRAGGYPEAKVLNTLYRRRIASGVVICPTQVVAEQVIGWLNIPRERVFVTHLAPNDGFFKIPGAEKSEKPSVLMVGDANQRKRTLESVKALEGLAVDLVHVGRPWGSTPYGLQCIEEARKRGVNRIEVGQGSVADVCVAYNRAHALLYPSTDEGFGLPPIEAARCGLTSVVGRHPVFDEVMGENAYKADGRSVESIRHEVRAALASPIDPRRLTSRAANFQWQFCARDTLEAYEASLC